MSIAVIIGGLAVVAFAVVLVSWYRRDQIPDLGTVSHQWIAEERFGESRDSHR